MKSLFPRLLVVIVASIIGAHAFASTRNSNRQENAPKGNRLKWYADKAKRDGKQRVLVPGLIVEYAGSAANEIEETLTEYTVVRARLISQHTYQLDGDNLLTWYKFSVVENLTELRTPSCLSCLSLIPPLDIPIDNASEFLVPKNGGIVGIDGVEVRQFDPDFPDFQNHQEYLLLVLLYPNRVALTAGGPLGVFTIADGDRLTSFSNGSDKIKQGVQSKFGNSLARLKHFLKRP